MESHAGVVRRYLECVWGADEMAPLDELTADRVTAKAPAPRFWLGVVQVEVEPLVHRGTAVAPRSGAAG